uniref:methyl-accepting chemotaxis protein n=1 Tax=Neorhizobium sp. EC2-8 TaxID=3129230 RepID=UPI00310147CF
MFSIINRLPFRTILSLVALIPTLAIIGLGVALGWNAYVSFSQFDKARQLTTLMAPAASLFTAIANESFAGPTQRLAAREHVDALQSKLAGNYDRLKGLNISGMAFEQTMSNLHQRYMRLSEYRNKIDAGDKDPLLSAQYLTPLTQLVLDVMAGVSNATDDRTLSKAMDGLHSMVQVNNGSNIVGRMGQQFAKNGALTSDEIARFVQGRQQARIYEKHMRASLPPKILSRIDQFWQSVDGVFTNEMLKTFDTVKPYTPAAGDYEQWSNASDKRRLLMSGLIDEASDDLVSAADDLTSQAEAKLYMISAMLLALVALVACFSFMVVRSLSSSIRRIGNRMSDLAVGDTSAAIPYVQRKDVIGDMARSVEVFREAAIRNLELEEQAEADLRRSEGERAELQRRAEAEADIRLNQATSALASSLRRLANGDMLCEVEEPLAQQFESLRTDFNTSVQTLRSALLGVGGSVLTVNNGAQEVSEASDNLSKRTEQQAASLEETAAALEEITSNVVGTSRRTSEARDVVRDASTKADQSSKVVRDAVVAMERIEDSSKKIGQIIGVIDEIAFQTNLLALNAGVEAARAGEAGKGFAVVAQEVRELAQRSANAAKEIKSLISNSAVAVSEGVKLVNATGDGLAQIADLVGLINNHMDAIATAAQEQSAGLSQVNTAVNHMDQATQQNAAMVEEMTAAGAGLAEESTKLSGLLSGFKLTAANTGELRQVASRMRDAAAADGFAARRPPRPGVRQVP